MASVGATASAAVRRKEDGGMCRKWGEEEERGWVKSQQVKGKGGGGCRDLPSRGIRAYQGAPPQAIPCISSLCRRTRNTRLVDQPVILS